ncbi:MAG: PorP/SprF family type IX secretion system membrane protein, partial [Saprospiraceae bacterium]
GGYRRASNYLSAGAQVGFGQNSIDWSKLWFSRQFDSATETPDYGAANGEAFLDGSTNVYLDFNAGLMWYTVFGDNGFFYAGGAMHHLNKPKMSLQGDAGETLYSRWSGHLGGQLPVSDNFALLPGAQFVRQGPAMETDLGLNLRYSNNDVDELALRFGAWARVGNKLDRGFQMDAVTIVGMLELNRYVLGLSYDITVSNLTQANNSRGAFELSLSYIHPEHRRSRVVCPKL